MSVEFDRGSPGKFDSRTLSRETLSRWTGRSHITSRPGERRGLWPSATPKQQTLKNTKKKEKEHKDKEKKRMNKTNNNKYTSGIKTLTVTYNSNIEKNNEIRH